MLKTGNVPVNDTIAASRLPAAPNQKLHTAQREEEDDEEEELRKLQAEMAM
jgi:charged multivesicular body protein 4